MELYLTKCGRGQQPVIFFRPNLLFLNFLNNDFIACHVCVPTSSNHKLNIFLSNEAPGSETLD